MKRLVKKMLLFIALLPLLSVFVAIKPAYAVYKYDSDEILLATFFQNNHDEGLRPYIYTSTDGMDFEDSVRFAKNYVQNNYDFETRDSSIMYKDGYFWALSAMDPIGHKPVKHGTIRIDYSKDLVHWNLFTQSKSVYNIKLNKKYDDQMVAPEWFVDTNGQVYITFTAGHMSEPSYETNFDGSKDKVYPLIAKVTKLKANPDFDNPLKLYAPDIQTTKAKSLSLKSKIKYSLRDNYIYKKGDIYYLYARFYEPYTMQLWSSKSLNGRWKQVSDDIYNRPMSSTESFRQVEAPNFVKFKGQYIMYSDKYDSRTDPMVENSTIKKDYEGDIQYSLCSSVKLCSFPVKARGPRQLRHGTVLNVTDEHAKQIVWAYRDGASYRKGDLNGDGLVDENDLELLNKAVKIGDDFFVDAYFDAQYDAADINDDGIVDKNDIKKFSKKSKNKYLALNIIPKKNVLYAGKKSSFSVSVKNYGAELDNSSEYQIDYTGKNILGEREWTSTNMSELTVVPKNSAKMFEIKIDAVFKVDGKVVSKKVIRQNVYPSKTPSSILNLEVNRFKKKLKVSFNAPYLDSGEPISNYKFVLKENRTKQKYTKRIKKFSGVTFKSLSKNRRYSLKAYACNANGCSSKSSINVF